MKSFDEKRISGDFHDVRSWSARRRIGSLLVLYGVLFPTVAFGQWNSGNLNIAVGNGGTVTIPVGVNFSATSNAVGIVKPTILKGNASNNLPVGVGNLSSNIWGAFNAQKTDTTASLVDLVTNRVNAFNLPINMSFIDGAGQNRSTNDEAQFNNKKWLNINSGVQGTGLEYLHFRNVTINYTYNGTGAGGAANGFIGSVSNNISDITMGDLTGNVFTNISVALHGYTDKNYLAGGGVVGLRATGELGASSASTHMGNIAGNVFKGVKVKTDHAAAATGTGSAYIEGGGVIGVNAVSSPDKKSGNAYIQSFGNNLFTDISVVSDDIILGGGLLGVNNNSQNSDASTYSWLLGVSNNAFGNGKLNGENSDIYVHSGYSLRGGGVIGVNALSNAAVRLDSLTNNVFAGIYVDVGTYLRGGGIVGLQSNDGTDDKYAVLPADLLPVTAYLGNVDRNLFFNLQTNVGTHANGGYFQGGSMIGVRSNMGMASIYGVNNNIFKGLKVTVSKGNGTYAGLAGIIDGGGIVGASSLDKASILDVTGNYFD
ncbi:MAG: hypothetical protein LBR95_01710, partial [Azoarcus sp.]|nr:hypothetical protein [Azoarcus sp.]